MENKKQEVREFAVKENVLAATLQYLGTRPYAEVEQLIMALRQSKPPKEEIKEETKK